ncbi:MAG TPA: DUF5673 domain-containing protein [Candidatus Paceibacterota bacterium]|nr:DUF5673 domain-containing protein [Candidatus Paceibacterota bacterium]
MDEIKLETISWSAPEYTHKERGNDWFWAIGVITVVACGIAIWMHNYVFAIFLLLSGCCLIMFTLRHPQDVNYIIETRGLLMGKDLYSWKDIKSFNIKNKDNDLYAKLLIETKKYFLPIYTIPLPKERISEVKETLLKVSTRSEIDESKSMVFMEKLGF